MKVEMLELSWADLVARGLIKRMEIVLSPEARENNLRAMGLKLQ